MIKKYQPKPTAKLLIREANSEDAKREIWTPKGTSKLYDNGFEFLGGTYQYLLFRHGLNKLSQLE